MQNGSEIFIFLIFFGQHLLHYGTCYEAEIEFLEPRQKGQMGLMGPSGLRGPPGPKGEMGVMGPRGAPGHIGIRGNRGFQGSKGLQGSKGEKGDAGLTGPSGPPGWSELKGDKGISGPSGKTGLPGEKGDHGLPGTPALPGANCENDTMGPPGLPGVKGDQGISGPMGLPGIKGVKGDAGLPGHQGNKGENGDEGPQGPPGLQGLKGATGEAGPTGPEGSPGLRGEKGEQGIQGIPGMPGVCPVTCPVIRVADEMVYSEGEKPDPGSKELPLPAVCKFIPAFKEIGSNFTEQYWVKPDEKFLVECDMATYRTCLILGQNVSEWINGNTLVIQNAAKGMWLSKFGFDLNKFNTITKSQMTWLKLQSENVKQVIRFYIKNNNITYKRINLRILNSDDDLVDENPSEVTPMHFTVVHRGSVLIDSELWYYVDLLIVDDVDRLPIKDFFVKLMDEYSGDIYVSVQLQELCFG